MKPIVMTSRPVIEQIHKEVSDRAKKVALTLGRPPHLAVVLVGEDPASQIYTQKKGEVAVRLGMTHETIRLPVSASPAEVRARVDALNKSPAVDGILIQRPLPQGFSESEVVYWVDPKKDVDAFHPENVGRLVLGLPTFISCTPAGIIELLKFYQQPIAGKIACVVGRSAIVGKPMQALLLAADATVIQAHSRTPNLESLTRQADLLIVAAGKPKLIKARHVKEGAVVVDVGIHRGSDGKVYGDVDEAEVAPLCSAISPVPGGVGPMTIALLMKNTVTAAEG